MLQLIRDRDAPRFGQDGFTITGLIAPSRGTASLSAWRIVAEPGGTTFNLDCVLVHDDTGLAGQPGVTDLVVADPQWDTSGSYPAGLYVPGPDSPAVDACGFGTGAIPDLLGTARPQDLPVVVVPGAGHFFHRKLQVIKQVVLANRR